MSRILYKYYVFLDTINSVIENNLNKIKNINIIVNVNYNNKESLKKELSIIDFAKKNKIPFILKNNYQKCLQNKSDGILIDSSNKKIIKPILLKKKFVIIGIAHNQLEYLQIWFYHFKIEIFTTKGKIPPRSNKKTLSTLYVQ